MPDKIEGQEEQKDAKDKAADPFAEKLQDYVSAAVTASKPQFEAYNAKTVADTATVAAATAVAKKAELDAICDSLNTLLRTDKTPADKIPASVGTSEKYGAKTGIYIFADTVDGDSFKALKKTLEEKHIAIDEAVKHDSDEGRACLLIKDSADLAALKEPGFSADFETNLQQLQAANKPAETKNEPTPELRADKPPEIKPDNEPPPADDEDVYVELNSPKGPSLTAAAEADMEKLEKLIQQAETLRAGIKAFEDNTSDSRQKSEQDALAADTAVASAKKELEAALQATKDISLGDTDKAQQAIAKAGTAIDQIASAREAATAALTSAIKTKEAIEAEQTAKYKARTAAGDANDQVIHYNLESDSTIQGRVGLAAANKSAEEAKEALEAYEQAITKETERLKQIETMAGVARTIHEAAKEKLTPREAKVDSWDKEKKHDDKDEFERNENAELEAKAKEDVKALKDAKTKATKTATERDAAQANFEAVRAEREDLVKEAIRENKSDYEIRRVATKVATEMKDSADAVQRLAEQVASAAGNFSVLVHASGMSDVEKARETALFKEAGDKLVDAEAQATYVANINETAARLITLAEGELEEAKAAAEAEAAKKKARTKPDAKADEPQPEEEEVAPDAVSAESEDANFFTRQLNKMKKKYAAARANSSSDNAIDATGVTSLTPAKQSNKSSVRDENKANLSIEDIAEHFRVAMKQHEEYYHDDLGYKISSQTKKSFVVTDNAGKQLLAVEKDTDKSISYRFPENKELDFQLTDVVLRTVSQAKAKEKQVLILHSPNPQHIEEILKAAATPPNSENVIIKLDASTEKLLKKKTEAELEGFEFIKYRLGIDKIKTASGTSAQAEKAAQAVLEKAQQKSTAAETDHKKTEEELVQAKLKVSAVALLSPAEQKVAQDEKGEIEKRLAIAAAEVQKTTKAVEAATLALEKAKTEALSTKQGESGIKEQEKQAAEVAANKLKKAGATKKGLKL